MRHRVYGRHLSRNKNERTALFKNLVQSLFLEEKIQTTEAKAKAIKGLVDRLIHQAKTPQSQKLITQFLVKKETSEKLIKDIAPRYSDRVSGFTSMVRIGKRLGDGAMMVQMNLIEGKKESNAKVQVTSKKGGKVA